MDMMRWERWLEKDARERDGLETIFQKVWYGRDVLGMTLWYPEQGNAERWQGEKDTPQRMLQKMWSSRERERWFRNDRYSKQYALAEMF